MNIRVDLDVNHILRLEIIDLHICKVFQARRSYIPNRLDQAGRSVQDSANRAVQVSLSMLPEKPLVGMRSPRRLGFLITVAGPVIQLIDLLSYAPLQLLRLDVPVLDFGIRVAKALDVSDGFCGVELAIFNVKGGQC